MSTLQSSKVTIYDSLECHEDWLTALSALFEKFQLFSAEAAFPTEDIFTFRDRTIYFGVITKNITTNHKPKEEEQEEKEQEEKEQEESACRCTSAYTAPQPRSSSWDTAPSYNHLHAGLPGQQEQGSWGPSEGSSYFEGFNYEPPPIGFIYLISSQNPPYPPDLIGELTVGLIIASEHRCKGYAKEAVQLILDHAFRVLKAHRVQATILDTYLKDRAITLFTQMHFEHEGTRRRSFYSQMEHQWKDTTCLAILDTDWALRSPFRSSRKTIWDELLDRHHREREELLRWEGNLFRTGIKRTSSVETIRVSVPTVSTSMADSEAEPLASDGEFLDSALESSSVIHTSVDKGKRKLSMSTDERNAPDVGRSFQRGVYDSDFDDSPRTAKQKKTLIQRVDTAADGSESEDDGEGMEGFGHYDPEWRDLWRASRGSLEHDAVPRSPSPSVSSSSSRWSSRHPNSDIEDGYSSAQSQWDLLETSSSASTSSFDEISDGLDN